MSPSAAKRKLTQLINSPENECRVANRRAGEQVRRTAMNPAAFEVVPSEDGVGCIVRYIGRD